MCRNDFFLHMLISIHFPFSISLALYLCHTHLAPGGETSVFLILISDSPVIEPVERKETSAMRTNLSSGFRTGNRLGFTAYKRTSPAFIQSAFVLPAFVQGDAPAWSESPTIKSGFCMIDVHTALSIKSNNVGALTSISASYRYERLSFQ